ncbi:MAG TPA: response regulator [Bacteroidota bacterium]|nr:response regulator [Bacteroidota bacterium]
MQNSSERQQKILVVDEEPGLRLVVESEVARAGYAVQCLSNGLDAISRLSKERFDLAILGINLPEKSGLEVLKYIREKHLPTRVLMITGFDTLPAAIKAVRMGADDFIPKPFDGGYLLTVVRNVLKHK